MQNQAFGSHFKILSFSLLLTKIQDKIGKSFYPSGLNMESIYFSEISFCRPKHYVKSVRIRSFSGLYFPLFRLNTERYGVSIRIHSKCGKTWTRKFPNIDAFHAVKRSWFGTTAIYVNLMWQTKISYYFCIWKVLWTEAVTRRCFIKKLFLEISQNSQEKTCTRLFFFNKIAGLRPLTLLKKRLWQRSFPVNFAKFLRTPFWQNTSGRMFLSEMVAGTVKG